MNINDSGEIFRVTMESFVFGHKFYVHAIAIMLDIIVYIYTFCTKRENFVIWNIFVYTPGQNV